MVMLEDHDVADYEVLLDMDATDVGRLSESDRRCLNALGEYLVATASYERFSIWLLHKHFHPLPGEVFVEWVPSDERIRLTGPKPRTHFAFDDLTPTALRFDSALDDLSLVGMEFAVRADLGTMRPFDDDDELLLRGLRDALEVHGKTDRFGVRLIRDPIGLTDDEILVETCNLESRLLRCDVALRDSLSAPTIVETAWQWSPGSDGQTPSMDCRTLCTQVCLDNHDDRGHRSTHGSGAHNHTNY